MITIALQLAWAVLTLAYGALAWGVARHPARAFASPARQRGWWAAGVGFTLLGASSVFFNSWAAYAFAQGPGSAAWEGILRWTRVGSFGRAGLVFAVALALALAAHRAAISPRRYRALGWGLYGAALLGGGAWGWAAGEVVGRGGAHFGDIALLCAAEAILLMAVLAYALHRDSMDRYLWLSVCIYTVTLVLNVVWFTAMAWIDQPGAWSPLRYGLHLYTIAAKLLMIGAVARKLALVRRGRLAPDVLAPLPGRRRAPGEGRLLWKLSDAE